MCGWRRTRPMGWDKAKSVGNVRNADLTEEKHISRGPLHGTKVDETLRRGQLILIIISWSYQIPEN
jgi:hypothetical protein